MTENDWPEYYSVLGEFVVNFENIVFDIKQDCSFILKSKGLKDEILGEIIFGQRFFTAEPIVSCYVTMVHHIVKHANEKEKITKQLNDIRTKFSKLIEVRNGILHSTHFFVESIVIVGPPTLRNEFKAYKPSPKKTGYDLKKTPRPQIIEFTKQLKELRKLLKVFIEELHKFMIANKIIEAETKKLNQKA